jgi:hypothetical protein
VGTVDYASPEQLQAAEVDRTTDVSRAMAKQPADRYPSAGALAADALAAASEAGPPAPWSISRPASAGPDADADAPTAA